MDSLGELGRVLDGFAGLAALINGLLLWPIVRTLKADHKDLKETHVDHGKRIARLEAK